MSSVVCLWMVRLHVVACRSFLPPRARLNNTLRYPQVLCIISQHLYFTLFYKVLHSVQLLVFTCHTCRHPAQQLPELTESAAQQEQVLQVAEVLLRQSDLLNGAPLASLPYASPTRLFLDSLSEQWAAKHAPGQVHCQGCPLGATC